MVKLKKWYIFQYFKIFKRNRKQYSTRGVPTEVKTFTNEKPKIELNRKRRNNVRGREIHHGNTGVTYVILGV